MELEIKKGISKSQENVRKRDQKQKDKLKKKLGNLNPKLPKK